MRFGTWFIGCQFIVLALAGGCVTPQHNISVPKHRTLCFSYLCSQPSVRTRGFKSMEIFSDGEAQLAFSIFDFKEGGFQLTDQQLKTLLADVCRMGILDIPDKVGKMQPGTEGMDITFQCIVNGVAHKKSIDYYGAEADPNHARKLDRIIRHVEGYIRTVGRKSR